MDRMETISDGRLLRVYFCESDRYDGHPLDEAIVDALQSAGISGATVIRGVAGYGGSAVLHTSHVVATLRGPAARHRGRRHAEKIGAVLPHLVGIAGDGLITTQPIEIHRRSPADEAQNRPSSVGVVWVDRLWPCHQQIVPSAPPCSRT